MPAKTEKQRRLMAAALHGAKFAKATALRKTIQARKCHPPTV